MLVERLFYVGQLITKVSLYRNHPTLSLVGFPVSYMFQYLHLGSSIYVVPVEKNKFHEPRQEIDANGVKLAKQGIFRPHLEPQRRTQKFQTKVSSLFAYLHLVLCPKTNFGSTECLLTIVPLILH